MHLDNESFILVKEGKKMVLLRLYDVKRRSIALGEVLVLENRLNKEKINVKVVGINKFNDFKEVYDNYDKSLLGYEEGTIASFKDMEKYYTKDDILKYKVVAIEIELV